MSNYKPQEALQLGLNVLIDQSCGGCHWHEFPYKIRNIISGDKRKEVKFSNLNDVWNYVKLLQIESNGHRKKGSQFSVLRDIAEQLPFFVCNNNILSRKAQKDISRFVDAKDTNTPPYSGSYDDIPAVWLQKWTIIKNAMIEREIKLRMKAEKQYGDK